MIRHGKTERKIDALTLETEDQINDFYSAAFTSALRKNTAALSRIRAIMDGEVKQPRYCVTDAQKARWRERKLTRILKASNLREDLIHAAQKAGEKSEQEIERMRDEVYTTAYNDTYNSLRK